MKNLFQLWNDALTTLDSDAVADRYSKDAVYLPTVSDELRTTRKGIKDYFDKFLQLKPKAKVLESYVSIGENWCKDVGIYEFTMGSDGSKVKARYSFVYVWEDGTWKISHHHSSAMPESSQAIDDAPILAEDEVRGLFDKWNTALATLNSAVVAKRYARDAVFLPAASDTPRTDYTSIKHYYDQYVLQKPQGIVLESHVSTGKGWCNDVGIYEMTMGEDGSKVKERYSFVYVYKDGEWKISHHHSSVMPESTGIGSSSD